MYCRLLGLKRSTNSGYEVSRYFEEHCESGSSVFESGS